MTPDRSGQRLFNRPPALQSDRDDSNAKSSALAPVGHAQCDSVMGQIPIAARVSRLLSRRCPSAVARFVVAVVINPIEAVQRRTRPCVLTERGEVGPSFTDANTAASVSFEVGIGRPRAAVNHCSPGPVFACFAPTSRRSVRQVLRGGEFSAKTTTTRGGPTSEIGRAHAGVDSTLTHAMPYAAVGLSLVSRPNDREPSEDHADQIFRGWLKHHFASICASMMRLTSSAMEMPRRLASRIRNFRCGSLNEIICFVILLSYLRRVFSFTALCCLGLLGGSIPKGIPCRQHEVAA
jgi:hypothetical protein